MSSEKKNRRKHQRGVAMVMALLAVFVLAMIGLAFMAMATTENSANRNYKDSQKAYFASRAGLEDVRAMLWNDPNFQARVTALNMPNSLNNSGIIYVYNPTGGEVIDPRANATLDDELCQERFANLVGTLTRPAVAGAPCGATGVATELMAPAPALNYYQTAAVPVPAFAPDIALPANDVPGANTANALPFKWVRITNKQNFMPLVNKNLDGSATTLPNLNGGNQVCWDGLKEVSAATCAAWNADPLHVADQANPVWLLTSLAISPGGSRRMTQMEVAFTPPISVNATIATSGGIKLTGKVTVDGNDNCTNKSLYSIYSGQCVPGSNNCSSAITNQVPPDNLTGNNGQTGVTVYNSSGGVQTPGSTGQGTWPYPVDQLINQYKQMAQSATGSPWNYNPNCSGNNCQTQTEQFGTFPTNPTNGQPESTNPVPADGTPAMVYVPGDLRLSSPKATGDGLLIVDGDLTVDGGLEYYGLILVKGQIHFTGGGSTPVNLYGAILAGDSASASDSVGGSFSFRYSSCALQQTAPPGPPKLLATHELMY